MKYAIIALLSVALLTGCETIRSDALTAPDVINYPQETFDKAAIEMEGGSCPVLNEMIVDYGVMRDQSRLLKGEKVDVNR